MRAVILAGGKGTRLHPYTVAFPKPLMPIEDMPIIEIVVRQLAHRGFTHITMALGHLAELMIAFLGDGERFGVKIDYSREDEPRGTAGPIAAIDDLPDTFLVMNGDLLTTLNYGKLVELHEQSGNDLTIAVHQRMVDINYGIIKSDAGGLVTGYEEKPVLPYEVSMGIYMFSKKALDYIPNDVHFDIPQLVIAMLENCKVGTHKYTGLWLDIGRADDYEEAQRIFSERRDEFLP